VAESAVDDDEFAEQPLLFLPFTLPVNNNHRPMMKSSFKSRANMPLTGLE